MPVKHKLNQATDLKVISVLKFFTELKANSRDLSAKFLHHLSNLALKPQILLLLS